jgi:hypothetical protein
MQLQGENVSEARRKQPGGDFRLRDAMALGLQVIAWLCAPLPRFFS